MDDDDVIEDEKTVRNETELHLERTRRPTRQWPEVLLSTLVVSVQPSDLRLSIELEAFLEPSIKPKTIDTRDGGRRAVFARGDNTLSIVWYPHGVVYWVMQGPEGTKARTGMVEVQIDD